MKKSVLTILILSVLLSVGCDENTPDSNTDLQNQQLPQEIKLAENADTLQIQSLKYPNKSYPETTISEGVIGQLPNLTGQDDDLFLINYLENGESKGFLFATKAQIENQQIVLNQFSYLISHEVMEHFLNLSYDDMLEFKDYLSSQLLKEDIDGNKTINYEDILSFQHTADGLKKLNFDYDLKVKDSSNEQKTTILEASKTGDIALLSKVINEVFDPITTPPEELLLKPVVKTEIRTGDRGQISANDALIETLNADNNLAVLLNNPLETNSTILRSNSANTITLTATATSPNAVFEGWEGCENEQGNQCIVNLNQNNNVYAHFGSLNILETPNWNTQTCAQAKEASANKELPLACLSLNNYPSPSEQHLALGRVVFSFGTDGCYASAPVYTDAAGQLKANPGVALGGSKTSKCNYFDQMNNAYLTYREVTSSNKKEYKARIFGLYAVKDQCSAVIDTINYLPENICGHVNEWEHVIVWMNNDKPEYVTHTRHGWIETKEAAKATHLAAAPNTFVFKYIQEGGMNSHYPDFAGSKNGIYSASESPTPQGTLFGLSAKQVLDYDRTDSTFKAWFQKNTSANQSWERVTQRVYDNNWLNSKVCPVRISSACEKHWIIPALYSKVSVMPKSWSEKDVKF